MESVQNSLIIIGWGRMGVTHTSVINGLYPNTFEFILVEPNSKVSIITRKTWGYKVVSDINEINVEDAVVLITTPLHS